MEIKKHCPACLFFLFVCFWACCVFALLYRVDAAKSKSSAALSPPRWWWITRSIRTDWLTFCSSRAQLFSSSLPLVTHASAKFPADFPSSRTGNSLCWLTRSHVSLCARLFVANKRDHLTRTHTYPLHQTLGKWNRRKLSSGKLTLETILAQILGLDPVVPNQRQKIAPTKGAKIFSRCFISN